MVRGEAVLFILTVCMHVNVINMGSVFDQFATPEKKDKNKMLMYLRGLLKAETTTAKATHVAISGGPSFLKLDKIWDKPDTNDKSKMLAYLRGIKDPSSLYSVYEDPQHRGTIQTLHSQGEEAKSFSSKTSQDNPDIMANPSIESGKVSEQQLPWGDQATPMPILHPIQQKESESDTCFWRGQQSPVVDQDTPNLALRQGAGPHPLDTSSDFENVGEKVIGFFECAKSKFWKSYAKLQKKICSLF